MQADPHKAADRTSSAGELPSTLQPQPLRSMASSTGEDSPPGTSSPGSVRPGTISKPPSVDERRQKRIQTVHGTYTREEERQVLRKIDIVILPMMCFVFFMQYLDKQSLSYASVSFVLVLVWRIMSEALHFDSIADR